MKIHLSPNELSRVQAEAEKKTRRERIVCVRESERHLAAMRRMQFSQEKDLKQKSEMNRIAGSMRKTQQMVQGAAEKLEQSIVCGEARVRAEILRRRNEDDASAVSSLKKYLDKQQTLRGACAIHKEAANSAQKRSQEVLAKNRIASSKKCKPKVNLSVTHLPRFSKALSMIQKSVEDIDSVKKEQNSKNRNAIGYVYPGMQNADVAEKLFSRSRFHAHQHEYVKNDTADLENAKICAKKEEQCLIDKERKNLKDAAMCKNRAQSRGKTAENKLRTDKWEVKFLEALELIEKQDKKVRSVKNVEVPFIKPHVAEKSFASWGSHTLDDFLEEFSSLFGELENTAQE